MPHDAELADLVLDPASRWRSPWLQAVALYTEMLSAPQVAARHARELAGTGRPTPPTPVLAELVLAADSRLPSEGV